MRIAGLGEFVHYVSMYPVDAYAHFTAAHPRRLHPMCFFVMGIGASKSRMQGRKQEFVSDQVALPYINAHVT
jgi:hypothetical protein